MHYSFFFNCQSGGAAHTCNSTLESGKLSTFLNLQVPSVFTRVSNNVLVERGRARLGAGVRLARAEWTLLPAVHRYRSGVDGGEGTGCQALGEEVAECSAAPFPNAVQCCDAAACCLGGCTLSEQSYSTHIHRHHHWRLTLWFFVFFPVASRRRNYLWPRISNSD